MGVDLHDVPHDRPAADLDHGLGADRGLLAQPRAEAARERSRPWVRARSLPGPPSAGRGVRRPAAMWPSSILSRIRSRPRGSSASAKPMAAQPGRRGRRSSRPASCAAGGRAPARAKRPKSTLVGAAVDGGVGVDGHLGPRQRGRPRPRPGRGPGSWRLSVPALTTRSARRSRLARRSAQSMARAMSADVDERTPGGAVAEHGDPARGQRAGDEVVEHEIEAQPGATCRRRWRSEGRSRPCRRRARPAPSRCRPWTRA